jgi:hypothetical protein
MNKILSIIALLLFAVLIAQNSACRKEIPDCNDNNCPGMLRCNQDGLCACADSEIQVPSSKLCAKLEQYNFLAAQTSGTCLPKNFMLRFIENPDSVRHNDPNQGIAAMLSYAADEFGKDTPTTEYEKFDVNPDGIVGDKMRLYPLFKWYPTGIVADGGCDYIIEGEWTHPDTLRTTMRMLSCIPADIPEASNIFRVSFVRVK